MDQLSSDVSIGGEQMPAIGGPDNSWIWEVDSAHDRGEGCSLLNVDGPSIGESSKRQGAKCEGVDKVVHRIVYQV